LETKDGDRESLETKDGDPESLETTERIRRVETCRAEQECHVEITGLHRTSDSPVILGPGEEAPHLGGGATHRRATIITGISGTAALGRTSVREGQVCQPGVTDLGPGVGRSRGPCAKGK